MLLFEKVYITALCAHVSCLQYNAMLASGTPGIAVLALRVWTKSGCTAIARYHHSQSTEIDTGLLVMHHLQLSSVKANRW
jgi:hypothetical protein